MVLLVFGGETMVKFACGSRIGKLNAIDDNVIRIQMYICHRIGLCMQTLYLNWLNTSAG